MCTPSMIQIDCVIESSKLLSPESLDPSVEVRVVVPAQNGMKSRE